MKQEVEDRITRMRFLESHKELDHLINNDSTVAAYMKHYIDGVADWVTVLESLVSALAHEKQNYIHQITEYHKQNAVTPFKQ